MVQILTSNLFASGKTVMFKLNYPFELIANRRKGSSGGSHRDIPRTYSTNLRLLLEHLYQSTDFKELEKQFSINHLPHFNKNLSL